MQHRSDPRDDVSLLRCGRYFINGNYCFALTRTQASVCFSFVDTSNSAEKQEVGVVSYRPPSRCDQELATNSSCFLVLFQPGTDRSAIRDPLHLPPPPHLPRLLVLFLVLVLFLSSFILFLFFFLCPFIFRASSSETAHIVCERSFSGGLFLVEAVSCASASIN